MENPGVDSGSVDKEAITPISPKDALKELANVWTEVKDYKSGSINLENLRDYMLPRAKNDAVMTTRLTKVINLINHKSKDPNLDSAPKEWVSDVLDYAWDKHRIDASYWKTGSKEEGQLTQKMDEIDKIRTGLAAFSPQTQITSSGITLLR